MLKTLIRLTVAAVFALIAALPAAARPYTIQPGDVLNLQVLEDSSLNRSMLVLPDGTVTVPLVGSVQASGNTIDALRASITSKLASNFSTKPTVYLSVASLAAKAAAAGSSTAATIPVYALGEVSKPGKAEIAPGTTLLQFLAQAGGVTPYAATKRILVRRTGSDGVTRIYHYNYKAVLAGKSVTPMVLRSGDVIMVPTRRLFE